MSDYDYRPWRSYRDKTHANKYENDRDRSMSGGYRSGRSYGLDEREQRREHYNSSQNRRGYYESLNDHPERYSSSGERKHDLSFLRYIPDDAFGGRYGRDNLETNDGRRRRDYENGDYEYRGQMNRPSEGGYPPYPSSMNSHQSHRTPEDNERGFMERASDEFRSWFGDSDALRRREQDHRGRGPKAYVRSDAHILEDVYERLTEDAWIDASDIDLSVSDGEVILSGTVDDRSSKRRAEDITEDIRGVKHVQNNLRYGANAISPTNDPLS